MHTSYRHRLKSDSPTCDRVHLKGFARPESYCTKGPTNKNPCGHATVRDLEFLATRDTSGNISHGYFLKQEFGIQRIRDYFRAKFEPLTPQVHPSQIARA